MNRQSRPSPKLESLEHRQLASTSYVQISHKITPSVTSGKATYFNTTLPAGDYMIAVVGGSMTYKDSVKRPVYRVNDYDQGDFGYKIVQPGVSRAINAPGVSVPKSSSKIAAADSVGVYLKFRHSAAGRIGIELYDQPLYDNAAGALGAPTFILKERIGTTPAVMHPAVVSWSSTPIVPIEPSLKNLIDA